MEYLEFELPIKELEDQLQKCQIIGEESDVDVSETCVQIQKKLDLAKKDIYKNLTPWQRVQLSRHPNRPYTLDYINAICGDSFLELHGDRNFKDDKAMIGGLGKIGDQSFMFIGQQKGYNTKTRQYRNFGMANPEGYRKALRLMKMADEMMLSAWLIMLLPRLIRHSSLKRPSLSQIGCIKLPVIYTAIRVPVIQLFPIIWKLKRGALRHF